MAKDLNEIELAFFQVWNMTMTDCVRAARDADKVKRERYSQLLEAMVDAYPAMAANCIDPEIVKEMREKGPH
jgi:hypothetical protein